MTREEFAEAMETFLSAYEVYVIAGHVRPDGDCIGAGVALGLYLESQGKEVYLYREGDVARYQPMAGYVQELTETIKEGLRKRPYAFILLDLTDPERTGGGKELFQNAADTLCIDHHVSDTVFARLNHVESGMSATSEILYHLFRLMEVPLTKKMAEALYWGIAFDTGGFRHTSTTGDTYRAAGDLLDAGVSCTDILNRLYHSRSFRESRTLSLVLRKARLYKDGIVMAALESRDFKKLGAAPEDAEGTVGSLAEISEARVAVLLKETEDGTIRVSLRSVGEDSADVAAVARRFGGGGHIKAAGCTLKGPMLLAKQSLLQAVRDEIAARERIAAQEQDTAQQHITAQEQDTAQQRIAARERIE